MKTTKVEIVAPNSHYKTMKLFHYTDQEGHESILRQGVIRPSRTGKYGPGVYLTDLDYRQSEKDEIARDLFQGGAYNRLDAGRLDYHIQLEIPDYEIYEERPHVYRYNGGSLVLSRYEIVSKGDYSAFLEFLKTLALVAAAGAGASLLMSGAQSMADGQQRRTLELGQRLEKLLSEDWQCAEWCSVQTNASCTETAVYCQRCFAEKQQRVRLTDVFEGGIFYATTIDEKKVSKQLMDHYVKEHFWDDNGLYFVAVGGILVVALYRWLA